MSSLKLYKNVFIIFYILPHDNLIVYIISAQPAAREGIFYVVPLRIF